MPFADEMLPLDPEGVFLNETSLAKACYSGEVCIQGSDCHWQARLVWTYREHARYCLNKPFLLSKWNVHPRQNELPVWRWMWCR